MGRGGLLAGGPRAAPTCFILASSRRVCSSFRRSFLFPTRMMGTLGQKCFTSGVHFSGMFSTTVESYELRGCYPTASSQKPTPSFSSWSRESSPTVRILFSHHLHPVS